MYSAMIFSVVSERLRLTRSVSEAMAEAELSLPRSEAQPTHTEKSDGKKRGWQSLLYANVGGAPLGVDSILLGNI